MMLDSRRRWAMALAGTLLAAAPAVSRALSAEGDRLVAVLGLKPGQQAADVGAGGGEWAEQLARAVGDTGHVFATEVDQGELQKIQRRIQDTGLANITTV